jgi:hypothetical protein
MLCASRCIWAGFFPDTEGVTGAVGRLTMAVMTCYTSSRPALRAAGGRPPARQRHEGHGGTGLTSPHLTSPQSSVIWPTGTNGDLTPSDLLEEHSGDLFLLLVGAADEARTGADISGQGWPTS